MLVNPDQRAELIANPFEVFEIWKGGMSFHGAMIGVGVAMAGFAIANKVSLLGVADLVAACEPIGQCFGRLANFINGELWGRPTDLPWGMIFCNKHIAAENGGRVPRGGRGDDRAPSEPASTRPRWKGFCYSCCCASPPTGSSGCSGRAL